MNDVSVESMNHADFPGKIAACGVFLMTIVLGVLAKLSGFFAWVEYVVLCVAGIVSFHNYREYLKGLQRLISVEDPLEEIASIKKHFTTCVFLFVVGGVAIISHVPVSVVTLALCGVYFMYIRSNLAALKFLTRCNVSKVPVEPGDPAPTQVRQDEYVNAVSTSFHILRDENMLSFHGYALLTLLVSVVASLNHFNLLSGSGDAASLAGFAAGAAVFHLSVSVIEFGRLLHNDDSHKQSAAAATSDVVDMVIFVFGAARDPDERAARSGRALDVATHVVAGKVMRMELRSWLMTWLVVAGIFTMVASSTWAYEGNKSPQPRVAVEQQVVNE